MRCETLSGHSRNRRPLRQHLDDGEVRPVKSAGLAAACSANGASCTVSRRAIMDACFKATNELAGEIAKETPASRRPWIAERLQRTATNGFQVAEFGYDAYMIRNVRN